MQIKNNDLTFGGGNIAFYDETAVTNTFGADCDNCTETGLYFLPYGTANCVTGAMATMLVIAVKVNGSNNKTIHQFVFTAWDMNVYTRKIQFDAQVWSDWYQIQAVSTT